MSTATLAPGTPPAALDALAAALDSARARAAEARAQLDEAVAEAKRLDEAVSAAQQAANAAHLDLMMGRGDRTAATGPALQVGHEAVVAARGLVAARLEGLRAAGQAVARAGADLARAMHASGVREHRGYRDATPASAAPAWNPMFGPHRPVVTEFLVIRGITQAVHVPAPLPPAPEPDWRVEVIAPPPPGPTAAERFAARVREALADLEAAGPEAVARGQALVAALR